MRSRRGVRLRITLLATVVVGIALVVGGVLVVVLVRRGLEHSVAGTGPRRAAEIAAIAASSPLPDPLAPVDTPRRTLVQVVAADGHVVDASAPLRQAPALATQADLDVRTRAALPGGLTGPWLIEPTAAVVGGQPVVVVVATSLAALDRPVDLLARIFVLGLPLLLALVAAVTWMVVGRTMRPVEAMRAEVADISASSLHRRVPVPSTDEQLGRLAITLNDMLDRLESADVRQRRFVADASHELRTPLANLRTALEVVEVHPEGVDVRELVDDLTAQTARMQRLVDELLGLARAEGGPTVADRPIDLDTIVWDAAAAARRVPVTIESQPVAVDGDAVALRSLVDNLIDNAARHASTNVMVVVRPAGGTVELIVSDDGPGIAPSDRERVFERFVRLDDSRGRTAGSSGSGIGLAIVRSVAAAHGGTAGAEEPVGGVGARLVVRLPVSQRRLRVGSVG